MSALVDQITGDFGVEWYLHCQPLANPNSGSWHIPGTYTLQTYYVAARTFRVAGSGYTPRVGDVMFYDYPSPFGEHANIVIKNEAGVITTVGGNERGGIRLKTHQEQDLL